MSVSPTPPAASRRRLLLILLAAVVVVLVGVAIAVSAQAPRTDQQAATTPSSPSSAAASTDAPGSASPASSSSPTEEAATSAAAELLDQANTVCEMRVTEKYPTAEVQPGTKSAAKAKSGTFETTGSYTDPTAGKPTPMEFQCSSVNTSGSWTVNLDRG